MSSYEEAYAYLERRVDALKTNKTGDEKETEAEVFDKKTLMTIYDFMTSGYIDSVHYPISTGKEGNVFYATDGDGEPMALKIFRTSTSTFKRVAKYVEGDPRFRGITGNRWKLIYAWVNKEFKNLDRYAQAEIPVPEPITFSQNCLLMEYIGDESGPAPQLKDVVLEDPDETYEEVLSFIIEGWQKAHLVHGDLSEYNILMTEDGPVMIDVGQAMTSDHYNARELLARDIHNVNAFFRKRDAEVWTDDEVMDETINGNDEEEEEE